MMLSRLCQADFIYLFIYFAHYQRSRLLLLLASHKPLVLSFLSSSHTGTMNILISPCAARLPAHLYQPFMFSAVFLLFHRRSSTHPQSCFTILQCSSHPQFLCPYAVLSFLEVRMKFSKNSS